MSVRYVVSGENALGYVDDRCPGLMGVLAGDVFAGGPDPMNGPISLLGASSRPATLADFERFRVMPPPEMRVTPLDLGGCVIGLAQQADGSIRIVP